MACSFCNDYGLEADWIPPADSIPGHVRLRACIVCGIVTVPATMQPPQSLHTSPAQEAHTQPEESEAAGHDVRSNHAAVIAGAWLRLVEEVESHSPDRWHHEKQAQVVTMGALVVARAEGYAAGKADALARVRAQVEAAGWAHRATMVGVLAIIDRVAGEGS